MYEVNCFDSDGNSINYLTQWDANLKLHIPMDGYDLTQTPEVHFCNKNSEEALVVVATVKNTTLIADIPNTLLQESYPLICHIYLSKKNTDNTLAQKTEFTITIPIRERKKPSDYLYVENVTGYTIDDLVNLVYEKLMENMDTALSTTSNDPVQNKVIAKKFNELETKINNLHK